MKNIHILRHRTMSRRTILRGAGACLSLPFLEAMTPSSREHGPEVPKRLAVFSEPFGVVEKKFHPIDRGPDYTLPETLQQLAALKNDFSVFSNLDHDVRGGHSACHTFLSGVKLTERAKYPEGNVTIDQRAGEIVGHATRFSSLNFWHEGMSYTRTGVRVPSIRKPSEAFRLLFVNQSPDEIASERASIASSDSILDTVLDEAKSLQKNLGRSDREKLEEYFSSIRETERKLQISESWLDKPKPTADDPSMKGVATGARDENFGGNLVEIWFDLMYLALQTDSTRVVAMATDNCNWGLDGVTDSFHTLSHHGLREDKLKQLAIIEQYMMGQFGRFVQRLKDTPEVTGGTMLDNTQVLFGSGLGSGSRHSCENLPLILAGGGFKHGQHLDMERKVPLCNLYLTMLQQMGGELEQFNRSRGTFGDLI